MEGEVNMYTFKKWASFAVSFVSEVVIFHKSSKWLHTKLKCTAFVFIIIKMLQFTQYMKKDFKN